MTLSNPRCWKLGSSYKNLTKIIETLRVYLKEVRDVLFCVESRGELASRTNVIS